MTKSLQTSTLVMACLSVTACNAGQSPQSGNLKESFVDNQSATSSEAIAAATAATDDAASVQAPSGSSANTAAPSTSIAPADESASHMAVSSEQPTTGGAESDDTTSPVNVSGEVSTEPGREATGTAEPIDPSPEACVASALVETTSSGSGPHEVVVETNSAPGIDEGTIFRPADLGGAEKYPIFVWGQGGCSKNGLSNASAMTEIASHGYFVVADGTPNGSGNRTMDRSDLLGMGAPLMAYVDWAIAENKKPCSAYYESLDVVKVASNGFSCGGLMAQGTVLDPRIVTWGVTSSGMAGATQDFYDAIHTPVLFVEGGPDDVAYDGGLEGYERTAELGVPVMWFDKALGHGGDLFQSDGGDFTKINLAWLNWWLKGDESTNGKGLLVGEGCSYCSNNDWDVASSNIQ